MIRRAQLKLRLREPLRAALEAAARSNGRSLNAEMVERLGRSIDADPLERVCAELAQLAEVERQLAAAVDEDTVH